MPLDMMDWIADELLNLEAHLTDEGYKMSNDNCKSITVYDQINKNGVIKMYCPDCKPKGRSTKGTLMVSAYDSFCSGCGEDFKELAERLESEQ